LLLLRAMMESAPSLSSLPQRSQLQTINPIRIRAGRFDLFSHQQSTCKPGENFRTFVAVVRESGKLLFDFPYVLNAALYD